MARPDEDVLEQQAAEMLHVELLPGTEIMRDMGDIHFTHARGAEDIVLIPHPSADPRDPLNWSVAWKLLAIASQFVYTFISVESALSMAPMFPLLAAEYNLNETQLSLLTGVTVITGGYANFVIIPYSNIFGRRSANLISGVLVVVTCIWQAVARSHASLLAARIVNGFGSASNETLMMQVVADCFFLHERGSWTGLYFTAYFLGLFIGPVISGNIAERHGWRSFFWLSTGLAAFSLILTFFTFPETKYHRRQAEQSSSPSSEDGPRSDVARKQDSSITMDKSAELEEIDRQATLERSVTTMVGQGRPGKKQFNIIQRPDSRWRAFLISDITMPIRVFYNPIVFWAGLLVAGSANTLLFCNLTESAVFSSPPYNWNPSQVGYSNFAFVVGALIGLATAGPISDWVARLATKRNNGIREAEMRLPALIPYFITTAIGYTILSVGYERQWHWAIILVFGYGSVGLAVTTVPTIAIAYAIDCYKPISGEIMVVATVLKNTAGFAMSYWISPLAEREGYITPGMVMFALTIGPTFLAIPIWLWGKNLRRLTKDSSLHQMEAVI